MAHVHCSNTNYIVCRQEYPAYVIQNVFEILIPKSTPAFWSASCRTVVSAK